MAPRGPLKLNMADIENLRKRFRRGDRYVDIDDVAGFSKGLARHYATPEDWIEREVNTARRRIEAIKKKYPSYVGNVMLTVEKIND